MWKTIKEFYDASPDSLKKSISNLVKMHTELDNWHKTDDILGKTLDDMDSAIASHDRDKYKQLKTYYDNIIPGWERSAKQRDKYWSSDTFKNDSDAVHKAYLDAYQKEHPKWYMEGVDIPILLRDLLKTGGIDIPDDYIYDDSTQNIAGAVQGVM